MPDRLAVAAQIDQIADELRKSETVGKIDWSNFLQLIMELLPLIMALLAKDKPSIE